MYAVVHSVGNDYNVSLVSVRVTKEDKTGTILPRILKRLDGAGARPGLLPAGRGLFPASCINGPRRAGRRFLMPAVKNKRVKKAILEHHNGARKAASTSPSQTRTGREPGSTC